MTYRLALVAGWGLVDVVEDEGWVGAGLFVELEAELFADGVFDGEAAGGIGGESEGWMSAMRGPAGSLAGAGAWA
jgi:hypothetical protein